MTFKFYLRIFFHLELDFDERPFVQRRRNHGLLAIHGSCKIVNGSDRIERLGQNLQLFWFCTFSYFPLDSCTHYRPYQKKLTACLCLPHRRRLLVPWFSSWAITISNINKSITYSSFIFQSVQPGASIAS